MAELVSPAEWALARVQLSHKYQPSILCYSTFSQLSSKSFLKNFVSVKVELDNRCVNGGTDVVDRSTRIENMEQKQNGWEWGHNLKTGKL